MPLEFAFGIVPVRDTKVLLVRQKTRKSGLQWSIPKGHAEVGDSDEIASAERELLEETGLKPRKYLLAKQSFKEVYINPERGTEKTVIYWVAEVEDGPVVIQEEEIAGYAWLDWSQAIERATFSETKATLTQIMRQFRLG